MPAAPRRRARALAIGVLLLSLGQSAQASPPRACHVEGQSTWLRAQVLRLCIEAVPRVTAFWGPGWPQRVIVSFATDGDGVAALQRGDHVIVNAGVFATLSPVGQRVVITHEVTHVAAASATTSLSPLWLVEGLADLVGLRGSGLSVRVAAQELAADVRAGQVPVALPVPSDFTGTAAPQAYEQAWLAVTLLDERYGDARVIDAYRRAGRAGLAAALEDLGTSLPALTADWRVDLRRRLG